MRRDGLSIIEAVIAVSLLAIALTSILPAMTNFSRINTQQEVKTGAVVAAQQVLDRLRQADFDTWPQNGETQTVEVNAATYDVNISYCSAGSSDCYSTTFARHVNLEVEHHDKTVYEVETVYTRFD